MLYALGAGETAHRAPRITQRTRRCSVDHLLELLHRQGPHGLRRRLGLEDAWFLSEGIDALAGWCRRLLLQLHIQNATEFKRPSLLQLLRCELDQALHDTLHFLRFQ